ncbi:MAG: polymer-forming cytoskeletal protein [Chloroflexota bacterium]|nr:polymer-forming cytoskeletal protein [Anaerolineae bacterium]
MKRIAWKRALVVCLAILLFVLAAGPVLADSGEEAKVILGGSFTLHSGEVLSQDLVAFGGEVVLEEDSLVNGDIVLLGGSLSVSGKVNGDVVAIGSRLILNNNTVINGDLVALGSLERAPGAQVRGSTVRGGDLDIRGLERLQELEVLKQLPTQVRLYDWRMGTWGGWRYQAFRFIMTTLALMAVGVLITLFIPKQTELVGQTMIRSSLPSLGFGVLTFTVMTLATPVLVIICIGIPVAIVLWLAGSLAVLFGWLTAGLLIGRRIFQGFKAAETPAMLEIATGAAILSLLSAIPCVGPLFTLLVACWGFGAVILTRCGTATYPTPEPPHTPPVSPTEEEFPVVPAEELLAAEEGSKEKHSVTLEEDETEQEAEENKQPLVPSSIEDDPGVE